MAVNWRRILGSRGAQTRKALVRVGTVCMEGALALKFGQTKTQIWL